MHLKEIVTFNQKQIFFLLNYTINRKALQLHILSYKRKTFNEIQFLIENGFSLIDNHHRYITRLPDISQIYQPRSRSIMDNENIKNKLFDTSCIKVFGFTKPMCFTTNLYRGLHSQSLYRSITASQPLFFLRQNQFKKI